MLSPLWWLPLIVAGAGVIPIWRGARGLALEAAALQGSIAELSRVRPLVEQAKAELAAVDATRPTVGHTAAGHASGRGVHDLGPR